MDIVRKRFYSHFEAINVTYGSITKPKRKALDLEKTHYNDAIAINDIDTSFVDETNSGFQN